MPESVRLPSTLRELVGDVNITSPASGQILSFNSSSNKWQPSSATIDNLLQAIPLSNVIYVDPSGSDVTGALGRLDKPYNTIAAAVSASAVATSGSPILIKLSPGEYVNNTNPIVLPRYVSIQGAGRGATVIKSDVPLASSTKGPILRARGFATVRDLTIKCTLTDGTYQACIGTYSFVDGDGNFDNVYIYNCELLGSDTDCIYFNNIFGGTINAVFEKCYLSSKWDSVRTAGSAKISLYDCVIETIGPSANSQSEGNIRSIACGGGEVHMYGGEIYAHGGSGINTALYRDSGSLYAFGVQTNTSGVNAFDICNVLGSSDLLTVASIWRADGSRPTSSGLFTRAILTANIDGVANSISGVITESQVTNLVTDLSNKVSNSRSISTTAPLTGGGTLSSDLTLGISAASSSASGYITPSQFNQLNTATYNPVPSTIIARDGNANFGANIVYTNVVESSGNGLTLSVASAPGTNGATNNGGLLAISAGAGGFNISTSGVGGAGGGLFITAGGGGLGHPLNGTGGNGGSLTLNAGTGGVGAANGIDGAIILNSSQNKTPIIFRSLNDSNLFYADTTNNRIGIGKTNPSTKLDVFGTISTSGLISTGSGITINMSSGADPTNYLYFNNPTGHTPTIKWNSTAGAQGLHLYSNNNEIARFQDNGSCVFSKVATLGGLNIGDYFIQRGSSQKLHFNTTNDGPNLPACHFNGTGLTLGNNDIFLGIYPTASVGTTSGNTVITKINTIYNQTSGSASNTDLLINRTQIAVGSGTQLLIDAQVSGISKFSVSNTGLITGNGSGISNLNASNLSLGTVPNARLNIKTDVMVTFDGGGSTLTAVSGKYRSLGFDGTITGWTLLADASGSLSLDIKKCTYANFPTTSSICGGNVPSLSSAQKNTDSTLTSWTKTISSGDILEFAITGTPTTVTWASLVLNIQRT